MRALAGVLVLFTLAACGGGPRVESASEEESTAGAAASPESANASREALPPSAPVAVQGNEYTCELRLASGEMTAECEQGGLRCAEATRGQLTEHPGDEVLYRCNAADGDYPQVFALAGANSILWTLETYEVDDMCFVDDISLSLVDAVPDRARELLIRVRGCYEPGEMSDMDMLYKWQGGEMVRVISERMNCTYMGDTSDPDDEPPADAYYTCEGSYLHIGAGGDGPLVQRLVADQQPTPDARDERGHIQLRDVTTQSRAWDPESARFTDPTP